MDIGIYNGEIVLDHDNGAYYPGQVINGSVTFKQSDPVNITAINIQFLGEARVLWWEDEKEVRNGETIKTRVDYRGAEQYFNITQCLTGGQGVQQLLPGPHSIPFQFQIPHSLPSSFKGEHGEVVYEIHVFMEFPMKPRDELARLFEIVDPFDLNKADPEIAKPLQVSFEEVYSCGCSCSPSPVSIEVGIPATGFCPGQVVPVTIDVKNEANIEVKSISMQICSTTRFYSQQPVASRTVPEETLVSCKIGSILSKSERHFTSSLLVPDMIAPNLIRCHIIDVEYYFKVIVKLSGCNEDLEDTTQIYLGLKPLDNVFKGEYIHPLADRLPPGPIPEFNPFALPPLITQQNISGANAYPTAPSAPNAAAGPYPGPPASYPTPAGYPAPAAYPVPSPYPAPTPYPAPNPTYPATNFDIGFRNPPPSNPGYPM